MASSFPAAISALILVCHYCIMSGPHVISCLHNPSTATATPTASTATATASTATAVTSSESGESTDDEGPEATVAGGIHTTPQEHG